MSKELDILKKQVKELEEKVKELSGDKKELKVALIEYDEETGLKYEWSEPAPETMNWNEAKKWCEKWGDGWKFPFLDYFHRAIRHGVFNDEELENGYYFWSATETSSASAWNVYLYNGYTNYNSKSTNSSQVRCVRLVKD